MERNRNPSIPLDEWEVKIFGPRPPAYTPVPDYLGEDHDAPALRAYYAEWGAAIAANNAAAVAYAAAHKLRGESTDESRRKLQTETKPEGALEVVRRLTLWSQNHAEFRAVAPANRNPPRGNRRNIL